MRSQAAGKFLRVSFGVAIGLLIASGSSEEFTTAIAQAQTAPNVVNPNTAEADRLRTLGDQRVNEDQFQEALKLYQQAIDLYRKEGNRLAEGLTLRGMGNAYLGLKEFEKALEAQQGALKIARSIDNANLEIRALNNIGNIYQELKQLQKAIDFYQQGLQRAQSTQNDRLAQGVAKGLGDAYRRLNQSQQSLEAYNLALALGRKLPEESGTRVFEIVILDKMGDTYRSMSKFQEAVVAYEEGILLARQLDRSDLEIEVSLGLGRAYLGLSNYEKMISTMQGTIELAKQLNNKPVYLSALDILIIARISQMMEIDENAQNAEKIIANSNEILKLASEATTLATELQDQTTLQSIRTQEGNVYEARAKAEAERKNYSSAESDFQRARSLFQGVNSHVGEARVLRGLVSIYIDTNQWKKISPLLAQSLELSKKSNDPISQIFNLNTTAALYLDLGDPKMAQNIATQAITIGETIERSPGFMTENSKPQRKRNFMTGKGNALKLLARAAVQLGDFDRAIAATQQRRVLSQQADDRWAELDIIVLLAGIYYDQGDFNASQRIREEALKQVEKLTVDQPEKIVIARAKILYKLNFDYLENKNSMKSEQALKESLALIRSLPNRSPDIQAIELDILTGFVNLYATTKQYDQALRYGTEAYNLAIAAKNQKFELAALKYFNTIDLAQGRIDKILTRIDRMMAIAQAMPDPGDRGELIIAIASLYIQLGRYSTAQTLLQQTLSEARETGREALESQALSLLAGIAFSTRDTQQAIDLSNQSIALSREKSPPLAALSYLMVSMAQGELKNQNSAFEAIESALSIGQQAKNVAIQRSAFNVLGSVDYRFGKIDESIEHYQSALALSKPADEDWGLYAGLARSYEAKQQPIPAIAFYKKAVNQLEAIRSKLKDTPIEVQQSYLQATIDFGGVKTSDIYRYLADLLIQQGRIAEAQQVLELLKIQELNDINPATRSNPTRLAELALNPTEKAVQSKHENLIAFGQKTRDCKQNCTELKGELRSLRGEFETYVQTIQKTITDGTLVRVDERNKDFIASASKIVNSNPNSVLIYPLVLQDKTHLLWASKGGVLSSATCPLGEAKLNETIGAFQQALATEDDISLVMKHGKTLYDCLIKPLREKGDWDRNNIQHLIIAADRAIHYLPIAALYDGEKFLIERYTVSNILNAGLTNVDDKLPPQPTVLGFGISEAIGGADALPNVNQELSNIVRSDKTPSGIYPGKLFFNQATTISNLEDNLAKYPILHIATHGIFNAAQPNQSYLLFSNGKPGGADRYTVSQIQQQDDLRNVHLVILSACQTAQTESLANGTEIQSMSAAFLRDRAKSVIASLWNVNDLSTSRLMQLFYQNLATGRLTKAHALRQAQLQLLNAEATPTNKHQIPSRKQRSTNRANIEVKFTGTTPLPQASSMAHPYYWAPFILIGNSQ